MRVEAFLLADTAETQDNALNLTGVGYSYLRHNPDAPMEVTTAVVFLHEDGDPDNFLFKVAIALDQTILGQVEAFYIVTEADADPPRRRCFDAPVPVWLREPGLYVALLALEDEILARLPILVR